jgi:hypothetical protein
MSWEDEEYEPTITAAPAEVEVDKTRQELEAKPAVPEKPAAAVPLTLKPKHAAKREQQRHEEEAAAERAAAAARRAASAGLTPEEEQLRADREAAQDALGAASGKRLLATDVQSLLGAVALTEGAHFELLGRLAAQKAHAVRLRRGWAARACPTPPPLHRPTPPHPPDPPLRPRPRPRSCATAPK